MDHLIELDDVGRTFGPFVALRGVTLRLKPGRIGLLGPNGAGKSTLLKILMGLLPPTAGTRPGARPAELGGDGDGEGNCELRRLIGFMPEADALVPGLRGVEYVALAGELYGMPRSRPSGRAHEVLTYLELEDARYRRLEEYSTGMKQRLKLAQALVHDPPVLLLDEPTSGLDPAGRDAMLRLLLELGRDHGKSLILSHAPARRRGGGVRAGGDPDERRGPRAGDGGRAVRPPRRPLPRAGAGRAGGVPRRLGAVAGRGGQLQWRGASSGSRVPDGWVPRDFFRLAGECGVVVRAVLPDDETLEEMFLRTAASQ